MNKKTEYKTLGSLLAVSLLSGAILSAPFASADSSDTVNIKVKVPAACTLTATNNNLVKTINPGTSDTVGTANLKAVCNDPDGFAIYAIGYTDNTHGNNYLTTSLGDDYKIPTGTNTSGNTSSWFMTIDNDNVTGNYTATIENSFDNPHIVPDTNTKIATVTSETDQTIGTNLTATFDAYISPSQAAGTYQGKVKFTLVHPSDHSAPPSRPAQLESSGRAIGVKIKSLAAGTEVAYNAKDTHMKAFRRADSLPEGFVPSAANTISAEDAEHPVYIFFDNTNDAGIMYYYTDGDKVILPEDSSLMFTANNALSDISGLADFDSSNVTDLSMFLADTAITNLDALADWDTSNVTSLSLAFGTNVISYNNGLRSKLTDISGIANWDTSNVTNMSFLLMCDDQLTSVEAIENWDTSNVTNMSTMFAWAESITSMDLSHWDTSNVTQMMGTFMGMESLTSLNLSGWDFSKVSSLSNMFSGNNALETLDATGWNTSNVTDMSGMFSVGDSYVGNGQLREIKGIGDWDVSNVTDMTTMFYGAGQMTHYDIANWNVSKVESMNHMFCDNFKLESLDLSKWDVSSVKTMYDMFDDDRALTTLGDVSQWNTANLIDVGGWLNGATSFVGDNGTLDLSGWDTSNLKTAGEAFRATKLQTIDLSGWRFGSIINGSWDGTGSGIYYEYGNQSSGNKGFGTMFKDMPQLNKVYIDQAGLTSFNEAVNRGINTSNMWSGSPISSFTVK